MPTRTPVFRGSPRSLENRQALAWSSDAHRPFLAWSSRDSVSFLGVFLALNSISGALERPPQDRAAVGGIKPRLTLLMRVTVCFPQRDHASTRPILHNQPRQRAFLERGSTANGLMTGSPGFNLSWKKKRRKDESPGGPRTNNPAAQLADHITG